MPGNSTPIGRLLPNGYGFKVVGLCCLERLRLLAELTRVELATVPVYRDNIYPYKQTCAYCGRLLVEGQTPSWPELFDGRR